MAAFDYAGLRAMAAGLLADAKQGAVVLVRDTVAVDPFQPWDQTLTTSVTETLTAVVKGVSQQFVDGTAVLASDREVLCVPPAMGVRPSDRVTIDGMSASIVRVLPIPAAGEPVVTRLIVRG